MAQFIAFVSAKQRSSRPFRRSGNFQEPDRSRARKRGRSSAVIPPLLNRPNCRKLPLSLIRQTQGSRGAREISFSAITGARRVKAFINNNYREDRTKTVSETGGERGKGTRSARQRKSRMSTLLHGLYAAAAIYRFTKLSYARRSRINYSYKTHQSSLYFLSPARRSGRKEMLSRSIPRNWA